MPVRGGHALGCYDEEFVPEKANPVLEQRHKYYSAYSLFFPLMTEYFAPYPMVDDHTSCELKDQSFHPYFTQIDITCAALVGVHVGFNPGELVDFLLGWFGLDICNDDLSVARQEKKARKKKEGLERANKELQMQLASIPVTMITAEEVQQKVAQSGIALVRTEVPQHAISLLLPKDFIPQKTMPVCYNTTPCFFRRNDEAGLFPSLSLQSENSHELNDARGLIRLTKCGDLLVETRENAVARNVISHCAAIRHDGSWLVFRLHARENDPGLSPEFLMTIIKSVEEKQHYNQQGGQR